MLRERRVDGIVVQSSVVGTHYMGLLSDLEVPIVLINNQADGQYVYSVGIDNVASARLAVDHLIQHGHTRIGYISGPVDAVARGQRREGWAKALTAAALPVDETLVVEPVEGGGLPAGGEAGTRALLALPDPPTAIFCYNDMTALGALRAAREAGRRVPTDLSLVGFDDIALAGYTDPPLTTIAQPKTEMGRRAVEMLLALLDKANGAGVARAVLLAGRLVVRGSVAGARESSTKT
jgi:DNA-binding LacI/PurR family transcriptional regulator